MGAVAMAGALVGAGSMPIPAISFCIKASFSGVKGTPPAFIFVNIRRNGAAYPDNSGGNILSQDLNVVFLQSTLLPSIVE